MAADQLYKIKDLAYALGVGESTIRFWRDRYGEFLPSVGEGRKKRYRSGAIDVLRFIQEKANRSETAADIRDALSREFPVNIELHQESQRSSAAAQQQSSSEQQLVPQEFVDKLLECVQGLLSTQDQRMAALEAENRELRERLTRLEEQQTAIPQQNRSEIAAAKQSRGEIIAYLIKLRKEGLSFRAIAIRLTEEGVEGLRGGRWDGKTVSRLLKKQGIE